jgi:membrane fusion protein (multidrug efflux system)
VIVVICARMLQLCPVVLLVGIALSACNEAQTTPAAEASVPKAPQVSIVTMRPAALPYVRELPGRISALRVAEIRARVAGIVVERTFRQGTDVKAGDILYRLDPAPFRVELEAAEAALAKAKAVQDQAEQQAKRAEMLFNQHVASPAQHETAIATSRQAQADVAARQADVERAKLNLDYTVVRSPIDGRIGGALVTEGALVGQGEATHLATVQQLDPIYADFTQSVTELQQLRRDLETGALDKVAPEAATAKVVLGDGVAYRQPGKLLFSDASVDPGTGQVTLRGEFPNPKHELLPGMYVRVRIVQGVDDDALAVPQQAIQFDTGGDTQLYVMGSNNRVAVRKVRIGHLIDQRRIIRDGVKPGDRVVVEGFQKFDEGDLVDPVEWEDTAASEMAFDSTNSGEN